MKNYNYKKIIVSLALLVSAMILLVFSSCSSDENDSSSASPVNTTNENSSFSKGWYAYTASASGVTQKYFFYYDENHELTRAGSELQEWTGSVFNSMKNSYGYESVKEYLIKINDNSSLPSWASANSDSENSAEKQNVILTFDLNIPESSYISEDSSNEYYLCQTEEWVCAEVSDDLSEVTYRQNSVTLGEFYKLPTTTPTMLKYVYSQPISNWPGSPYYSSKVAEYDETVYHYDFILWNTKADGTGVSYNAGENIQPTSDTKLYAIYEKTYSKISYEYYGGIAIFSTNDEWVYNANENCTLAFYQNWGYSLYWTTSDSWSGREYRGDTWTRSTEDGKKYVSVNGKTVEYKIVDNTLTLYGKLFDCLPEETVWTRPSQE